MTPSNAPRPPLEPQRGSSLAGKAYWAMVQRVALTAAAIDAGYFLLFLWLGSVPLAALSSAVTRSARIGRGSVGAA